MKNNSKGSLTARQWAIEHWVAAIGLATLATTLAFFVHSSEVRQTQPTPANADVVVLPQEWSFALTDPLASLWRTLIFESLDPKTPISFTDHNYSPDDIPFSSKKDAMLLGEEPMNLVCLHKNARPLGAVYLSPHKKDEDDYSAYHAHIGLNKITEAMRYLHQGTCLLLGQSYLHWVEKLTPRKLKVYPVPRLRAQYRLDFPEKYRDDRISIHKVQEIFRTQAAPLIKFKDHEIRLILGRIQSRLPQYNTEFLAQATIANFNPVSLIALAFQESYLNPRSVSPTGVEGLMMLTQATAQFMGVQDRRQWRQSLEGGSRYLTWLEKKWRRKLGRREIAPLVLMSYNMGYGHVRDLYHLQKSKDDSLVAYRVWEQVLKKSNPKLFPGNTARGEEGKLFVSRILSYKLLFRYGFGVVD